MIALIIVNYQKADLTVRACRSLMKLQAPSNLRLFIVDNETNASTQAELKKVAELGLWSEILFETKNHGYFGGARIALQRIRELKLNPDWVIISNSDIEFTDPRLLTRLEELPEDGSTGVIGPSIHSGLSHRDQNPYLIERPSRFRMHFYKWIFRYRPICLAYQMLGLMKSLVRRQKSTGAPLEPLRREIYAAHGSFMVFSKTYFARGGDFSHQPFLFGEEITVAETCRRLKLRVFYDPSLVISHVEHASMGWIPSSRLLRCQREASAYCADRFFSS